MEQRKSATSLFAEQQMAMPVEDELAAMEKEELEDSFDEEEQRMEEPMVESPAPVSEMFSQDAIDDLLVSSGASAAAPSAPNRMPRRGPELASPQTKRKKAMKRYIPQNTQKTSEDLQLEKEPIQVRHTGRLFWQRVIVPPNAYVVHTRIGKKDPVTIGLGISFRYKPATDTYIVIPAAMQTIGVVANCISKEKQGINILAYVQWQIEDFSIAYKKLDFSNKRDPLGIVNAQLREQAEAAIKDKIATMSVEDVLTDKAPVIAELTQRLKEVSEGKTDGTGAGKDGLGIKIVTVQIREAVVSSTSLWEDLQSPFRNEQKKQASISEMEMQDAIHKKRLETDRLAQERQILMDQEMEAARQKNETEAMERRLAEEARRKVLQEEARLMEMQQAEAHRKAQAEMQERESLRAHQARMKELELKRGALEEEHALAMEKLRLESELTIKTKENQIKTQKMEAQLKAEIKRIEEGLRQEMEKHQVEMEKALQEVRNTRSQEDLMAELVKTLPDIVERMPPIDELKVYQGSQENPHLAGLHQLLDSLGPLISRFVSRGAGPVQPQEGGTKEP